MAFFSINVKVSSFLTVQHVMLLMLMVMVDSIKAGICWLEVGNNGRCNRVLQMPVTREYCCSLGNGNFAWTPEDVDTGKLFYWTALSGGAPQCSPCKSTCEGVECEEGMKCKMRKGQPKCVCAPDCSEHRHRGPVCGMDGRTYENYCSLLKYNCRHLKHVTENYFGRCQKSCHDVTCEGDKHCVVTQDAVPHCIHCTNNCPNHPPRRERVCGSDGLTYASSCHIREANCLQGGTLTLAYKGACQADPNCGTVTCKFPGERCLIEPVTQMPQCVQCGECNLNDSSPVCGSDGNDYDSWCEMQNESCKTGRVIKAQHPGLCDDRSISVSSSEFYDEIASSELASSEASISL